MLIGLKSIIPSEIKYKNYVTFLSDNNPVRVAFEKKTRDDRVIEVLSPRGGTWLSVAVPLYSNTSLPNGACALLCVFLIVAIRVLKGMWQCIRVENVTENGNLMHSGTGPYCLNFAQASTKNKGNATLYTEGGLFTHNLCPSHNGKKGEWECV